MLHTADYYFRTTPDFPKPGVMFRDLSPTYASGERFQEVVFSAAEKVCEARSKCLTRVRPRLYPVSSRGYLLGAALSEFLGWDMFPVRRADKVPPPRVSKGSKSEYGEDAFALSGMDLPYEYGLNVIVDDVLATGGTIRSVAELLRTKIENPILAITILDIGLPLVDLGHGVEVKSVLSLREVGQ